MYFDRNFDVNCLNTPITNKRNLSMSLSIDFLLLLILTVTEITISIMTANY